VNGVERPTEGANEGKTPALSDEQANALLSAPPLYTLKGKRDRAILAVFLFHAVRRAELCSLRVKDYSERRGVKHFCVHGKGGKIRYIPPTRGQSVSWKNISMQPGTAARSAALVRLRALFDSRVRVHDLADTVGPVSERNCTGAITPGGEQREENDQAVTPWQ